MSEYCSQCSPFKELGEFEYNLFKIALDLKRGRSQSFLCEGCDNRAVYKDEDGRLYLGKKQSDGNIEMTPINLDELQV